MAAAWFSVILASGAFAIEFTAGSGDWSRFLDVLGWMALVHAAIGVGEALITGAVVRFLLLTRPDLLDGGLVDGVVARRRGGAGSPWRGWGSRWRSPRSWRRSRRSTRMGWSTSASRRSSSSRPRTPRRLSAVEAPIPDYAMPGLSRSKSLATAAAGVVGTLVVFGVGLGLARSLSGVGPGFGIDRVRRVGPRTWKGRSPMRVDALEPSARGLLGAAPPGRPPGQAGGDGGVRRRGGGHAAGIVAAPGGRGAWVLAFVVGLSGASRPLALGRRWLGFLALVGFLAAVVATGPPGPPERLGVVAVALGIVAKNSLAFLAMMVLVHVTPFRTLLAAMGRLGLPPLIVSTLQFMERQSFILVDELRRMVQARRSRTFRRSGRLDFGLAAGLIGMLFLRSFERGERVHAAMLARGWDGTVRSLEGDRFLMGMER